MAVNSPTIADSENQHSAPTKPLLSQFIAESAGSPGRLIDGRPFLRDEIDEKTRKAGAQCESILACLDADDDVGALHGVRRLVAYVRHIGTAAGWLDEANRTVTTALAARKASR